MRANPVVRAARGGLSGRRVQFIVIGLVLLLSAAVATLALRPPVDSSAPFDHAFATQHGSEVTTASKASPAQLTATTRLAGVTAAAGPFPETTVTATMLVPPPPGQSGPFLPNPQQMTVVGRANPGQGRRVAGRAADRDAPERLPRPAVRRATAAGGHRPGGPDSRDSLHRRAPVAASLATRPSTSSMTRRA